MKSHLMASGGKFLSAGLLLSSLAGCGGSSATPTGPAVSSVKISPTTVNVQVAQAQQFSATVTGTGSFDPSVQWFVNDISGGSVTLGTIVNGLYTAPAQPPNPATVTVKAKSTEDSSKSASAQTTIRPVLAPGIVWNETNLSAPGGSDGEVFVGELPPGVAVVDDGAGGAFVLWEHRFPVEILAQHLDASGQPTWPAGGIQVTNPWTGYQATPRAVSDGAGGAIVIWLDGRVGFCDPSFKGYCDIYAQRIDAAGTLLWGTAGKPITTAGNNQGVDGMAMISDGTGGAIVGFSDSRSGQDETVYVQRVDGNGDPVWRADGIRIADDGFVAQLKLIPDGAGGAIGAWYFTSYTGTPNISLRSQRISNSGQLLWGSSAVSVPGVTASDPSGTGAQTFDMTTDGSGGALFVASWLTPNATVFSVLAQRMNSSGAAAWVQSGAPVSSSTNYALNPAALADGSGGLFATWQDCPNIGNDCDIVMQHLNGTGQRTWGQSQVSVSKMPNQQLAPSLQPDGTGGALVMWLDCRAYVDVDCYYNSDVYAQDVDASGNIAWEKNGYPLLADPGNQGEQYYIYTPPPPVVSLHFQSGDILLAWPDGRDNICFTGNVSTACELYIERFEF